MELKEMEAILETEKKAKDKTKKELVWTIAMLVSLPPVGILLAWLLQKDWSEQVKKIVSIASGVWFVVLIVIAIASGNFFNFAGWFAIINFIIVTYLFLYSQHDPKETERLWELHYQAKIEKAKAKAEKNNYGFGANDTILSCPKCGNRIKDSFCSKCGHSLNQTPTPMPIPTPVVIQQPTPTPPSVVIQQQNHGGSVFGGVACAFSDHKWNGCKCTRCGEVRNKHHSFISINGNPDDDVCNICGITRRSSKKQGVCYIATAVYGSYDCPQVQILRNYRDDVLSNTWHGRTFIRLYYATSPTVVKFLGKKEWFNKFFRKRLDALVEMLRH
jgi:hypothetical protein